LKKSQKTLDKSEKYDNLLWRSKDSGWFMTINPAEDGTKRSYCVFLSCGRETFSFGRKKTPGGEIIA